MRPRHAHSVCQQAKRTSKQVGLDYSLSDILYSAAMINSGHTIGGYGPGHVNLICEALLEDNDLRTLIFESVLSRKMEDYILSDFSEELKSALESSEDSHRLKDEDQRRPFKEQIITPTKQELIEQQSSLIRQVITFAEKTNHEPLLKKTSADKTFLQVNRTISQVINNLAKIHKRNRIDAIDPNDPFELCEDLATILIPKLNDHHIHVGNEHIAEFIIRVFFAYTYLLVEASPSLLYVSEHDKVTYLSETTKVLPNIMYQAHNKNTTLDDIFKRAKKLRLSSPVHGSPINRKQRKILDNAEGSMKSNKKDKKDKKDMSPIKLAIAEELKSDTNSPLEFISDDKISLKHILAKALLEQQPKLKQYMKDEKEEQREISKKIFNIYRILFKPGAQIENFDEKFLEWHKMTARYKDWKRKDETTRVEIKPLDEISTVIPEKTDSLFDEATSQLSNWFTTHIWNYKKSKDIDFNSIREIFIQYQSDEDLNTQQLNYVLGKLRNALIQTRNNEETPKNLQKDIDIIEELLSSNLHANIKNNIKNKYNAIMLSSLFCKIKCNLVNNITNIIFKETLSLASEILETQEQASLYLFEKTYRTNKPQTKNSRSPLHKFFCCCTTQQTQPTIENLEESIESVTLESEILTSEIKKHISRITSKSEELHSAIEKLIDVISDVVKLQAGKTDSRTESQGINKQLLNNIELNLKSFLNTTVLLVIKCERLQSKIGENENTCLRDILNPELKNTELADVRNILLNNIPPQQNPRQKKFAEYLKEGRNTPSPFKEHKQKNNKHYITTQKLLNRVRETVSGVLLNLCYKNDRQLRSELDKCVNIIKQQTTIEELKEIISKHTNAPTTRHLKISSAEEKTISPVEIDYETKEDYPESTSIFRENKTGGLDDRHLLKVGGNSGICATPLLY
jgi:hypothetical protein